MRDAGRPSRIKWFLLPVLVELCLFPVRSGTGHSGPEHAWTRISYPPIRWTEGENARVIVMNQGHEGGFRLQLTFGGYREEDNPYGRVPPVEFRLHFADGKIVDPTWPPGLAGIGRVGALSLSYMVSFPWTDRFLEEAWIECHFGDQVFWLEIPYGFAGHPRRVKEEQIVEWGRSTFAPAMLPLREEDRLVPWQAAHYELGRVQDGWLEVIQTNSAVGRTELVFSRDDGRFLWDLHEPRTAVHLSSRDGTHRQARRMSVTLHEDGWRRSDGFLMGRLDREIRCWGTLAIEVGMEQFELLIPSSLYHSRHGHTARVPATPGLGRTPP